MADIKRRLIIKQGSGVPTIPVSADHRNGDWIATDIYEGEFYLNTDDGQLYTRNLNGICTPSGETPVQNYRVLISQSGTSAPAVNEFNNTIGAIVWTRVSAGTYNGTLTGAFTINKTECLCGTPRASDRNFYFYPKTANVVELLTYDAGVLTDTLLTNIVIDITVNP